MKNLFVIWCVTSIVLLIAGFSSGSITACILRALGAVFFILAFLTKLAQKMDSETNEPPAKH